MAKETALKVIPEVGNSVQPDGWIWWEKLEESDGFSDSSFPGCQFRLPSGCDNTVKLAVNIKVTGKPRWNGFSYTSRCIIEFVGDGGPSTFSGGIIYTKE